ncbi:hypothetical protein ACFWVT_09200 [Streptomyces cyaneofuscatus]|uniref:hypothetical protein n=1 Tax=Streptomyces cyaneofuscatus TaxID=66883 RepID=UPI00365D7AFA
MAVFMLQLADAVDAVIEADAAGRTAAGDIVLERTDRRGRAERLGTYQAETVTAVFRQCRADGGLYSWIPQPNDGTWWCY